jgi:hypothetical protein
MGAADPPATDRPTYRLLLRPEPGTPWELVRLRLILKRLLRPFGFRCLEAVQLPDGPPAAPAVPGQAPGREGGPVRGAREDAAMPREG